MPTATVVVAASGSPGRRLGVLAMVAGAACAREVAVRSLARVEEGGGRHLAVGVAWAAVTVPVLVVLVDANRLFFFALYGLFPQGFVILPRNWAIGFAAALFPTVTLGVEGLSAVDEGDFLLSALGSALVAVAIGLFIDAISRQSVQRHEALVGLEAAHAEAESLLQASLAVVRARTPEEVVTAVGASLANRGVKAVALRVGGTEVASWTAPAGGSETPAGAIAATGTALELPLPATAPGGAPDSR